MAADPVRVEAAIPRPPQRVPYAVYRQHCTSNVTGANGIQVLTTLAAAPSYGSQPVVANARSSMPTSPPTAGGNNVFNAAGRIRNDFPLQHPQEPTLLDNTQLFLPKCVVDELGLEPNMDDKDDSVKELWWGRLWELIALLGAGYREKLALKGLSLQLTPERAAELDRICTDPTWRPKLKRLAARWHGASIRKRCSLAVLEPARYCAIRGTLVYCHGSGGNSWDNMRICRMSSKMGVIVIVPDGFAYPEDTPMGKLRHKPLQPLKKATDDVNYWAGDLMYDGDATGELTYSTKADKVLEDPDGYRALYEKSYQLRRCELHFTLERLPEFVKAHGVFLGGTSEGAMTIARFDDQRYGSMIIGRFVNSFSIEYCYFTPTEEDGRIGGQIEVPTMNIIGTRDQFFGPIDSVAKLVAEDTDTGYGDTELDGHAFPQLVKQQVHRGLVVIFEDGVHSPCDTHDNFLRPLFDLFFRRAADIWQIDRIWGHDPYLSSTIQVAEQHIQPHSKITRIFCPTMQYPQKISLREIHKLHKLKGGTQVVTKLMQEEQDRKRAQRQEIHAMLCELHKKRKAESAAAGCEFAQDIRSHLERSSKKAALSGDVLRQGQ